MYLALLARDSAFHYCPSVAVSPSYPQPLQSPHAMDPLNASAPQAVSSWTPSLVVIHVREPVLLSDYAGADQLNRIAFAFTLTDPLSQSPSLSTSHMLQQ